MSEAPRSYAILALGLAAVLAATVLGWGDGLTIVAALVVGGALRSLVAPAPEQRSEAPSIPLSAALPDATSVSTGPPLWQQLLNAMPDAALILNASQKVVALNAAAAANYPGAQGRYLAQLDRSPALLEAADVAEASGSIQVFDLSPVAPVERHLSGIAAPLTPANDTAQGGAPALLIILRDRTEVERLSQMRADFVANASHELRTPLASLKGFVETLQSSAKDDPAARDQFLAIMQQQADRMSRLIDDLLSLSRIEMREHVPPTATVDIDTIATEVVAAMRPFADKHGVTLVAAVHRTGRVVKGDRDELMQVVQNLVQNAIKYGRRGGKVELSAAVAGERVTLSVADDGIGIAPEHLPRLTERFYRVNAKDSRERGGTGLGLAIVKHIINRHRGELRIASTPGVGSTFSVELPIVQ